MNFSSLVSRFLPHNRLENKRYLSILIDPKYAGASLWEKGSRGNPELLSYKKFLLKEDSWEERIDAIDRSIAYSEDQAGTHEDDTLQAILGLSLDYVTPNGEVTRESKNELKKLCKELSIAPLGFVVFHQAISHYLKKIEGIPPTIILLSISGHICTLILYKVGKYIGNRSFEFNGRITHGIEEALKSFDDVEILPSRMLLYGGDASVLEDIKQDVLGYPWQQKAGFLHYPKIDVLTDKQIFMAISLSGFEDLSEDEPSETEENKDSEEVLLEDDRQEVDTDVSVIDNVQEQESSKEEHAEIHSKTTPISEDEINVEEQKELKDSIEKEQLYSQTTVAQPSIHHDIDDSSVINEDHANVTMVDPQEMGFRKNIDVGLMVETPNKGRGSNEDLDNNTTFKTQQSEFKSHNERIAHTLTRAKNFGVKVLKKTKNSGFIISAAITMLVLVSIAWYMFVWVLPRSTVTVFSLPQPLNGSVDITINNSVGNGDTDKNILPAKTNEQTQTGETTVTVTGSKDVGDPAKGSVLLYNKTLEKRTLKKGTLLVSGSLEFALDGDETIASASESIGSITFGKESVAVTANTIGAQGNLPSGSEFTVKGVSSSIVSGRNDAAFTGGTSKKITVVSRADQTTLVENLTKELIEKAKQQLTGSVGGTDILIDDTIKTEVTDKKFQQEINEEALQLSGSITLKISGLSYSMNDVFTIAKREAMTFVSSGYVLDETMLKAEILSITTGKKDIVGVLNYSGRAIPTLETANITTQIAGKTKQEAAEYLRGVTGVAGVDFRTSFGFDSNRLPKKPENITVTVVPQE